MLLVVCPRHNRIGDSLFWRREVKGESEGMGREGGGGRGREGNLNVPTDIISSPTSLKKKTIMTKENMYYNVQIIEINI